MPKMKLFIKRTAGFLLEFLCILAITLALAAAPGLLSSSSSTIVITNQQRTSAK
jgi:hypothetical protein